MRFIITLLLITSFLNAGDKIALLIGNSDYSFAPLKNPTHDVDGIAQTLRDIGFKRSDIKVLKNASQSQMQKALANFSQKAQNAKIALIYFSGHGMQVNNTNYMFPARTTAKKPVDLYGLVDLNYFIQSATSAKYGIVLVDACRDNPLVKYFNNGKKGSVHKGLGQVTPTVGQMVIGFATSAGDTADDGNGNMSPYARALTERLKTPNKDITKVLGLVALDVSKHYSQNPIYRANLAYDVCLYGGCSQRVIHSEPKIIEKIVYRDRVVEPKPVEAVYVPTPVVEEVKPTTSKWITPKDSVCRANGGRIDKHGVCEAPWKNAKQICRASGGRLPTIEELKSVVTDCGGIVNKDWLDEYASKNANNSQYQNCYKKRGFFASDYYWSSTTHASYSNNAWVVYVSFGGQNDYFKDLNGYVRCVRAGE